MSSGKIPKLYLFLYTRLINRCGITIVPVSIINEIVAKAIVKKGGIPKFMVKHIIEDMKDMRLLERINFNSYKINTNPEYKRYKILLEYG